MVNKKYNVDLHTHSQLSYDGGLSEKDYAHLINNNILHYIAITDHNEIDFALKMNHTFGDRIIIGEEIMTTDGEIIGLFLQNKILSGLTPEQTVEEIKKQNGIVYIPHPFETQRKGIQLKVLENILHNVDIIEVFNARAMFRGKSSVANEFTSKHSISHASSSDAHCLMGVGSAYTIVNNPIEKNTIISLLNEGEFIKKYATIPSLFCPFINKIKHLL